MPASLERAGRLALVVLLSLALAVTVAVAPAEARQDLDAEQQFISLINRDRQSAGVSALQPAADVRDVALAWSNRMASERRMYHNPSYSSQLCCWTRVAENVGWTTIADMTDPGEVSSAVERLHKAFMDSDGHRKNIMNPHYDHIGLAIEMRADSCPNGTTTRSCMWVTENFRQWNGLSSPAGGLTNPYSGTSRDGLLDVGGVLASVSDVLVPSGFDGDVGTVTRLGTEADSAIQASQARFAAGKARHAVVSRDDAFTDSLAGAPLTHDGPLLLTPSSGLSKAVAAELSRVLEPGATVYLLGGPQALAPALDGQIEKLGLRPKRLAGSDRIETALTVASEVRDVYGDTRTVAVARAFGLPHDPNGTAGWVDSITGGAWAAKHRHPVVVTPTDHVPASVRAWLAGDAPTTRIVLGGPAAVSDAVKDAVHGRRVAGDDRAGTAAAVATTLWGVSPRAADRDFVVVDGWATDGWRHGLAVAGLAADAGAPMLLANSLSPDQPPATLTMLTSCDAPAVDLLVVGAITDALASSLEAVDGRAC